MVEIQQKYHGWQSTEKYIIVGKYDRKGMREKRTYSTRAPNERVFIELFHGGSSRDSNSPRCMKTPVKELSGAISLQTSSACVPVKIQLPHANWINLCNKGIREVNQPLGRALGKNEYKLFFSGRGKLFRQVTCVFSVTQGIKWGWVKS